MHQLIDIARQLRAQADALDQMVRDHNAITEQRTLTALDVAHRLSDEGATDRDALAAAASSMSVDLNSLRYIWNLAGHRQASEQRRWLMVRISDLTAAGLKDVDIARILSIHVKSIPRIRRLMKRRDPA